MSDTIMTAYITFSRRRPGSLSRATINHGDRRCRDTALIVAKFPRNPERTVALRKLLEAKDCAVRARLFK